MGGKCTVYEGTYEIRPKEIKFPDDDDISGDSDDSMMSVSPIHVAFGEGQRWKKVVSPGKVF